MLADCQSRGSLGVETRALLALRFGAGLPCSFLASLKVTGEEERIAPPVEVSETVERALHAWLAVRGAKPGSLFGPYSNRRARLLPDETDAKIFTRVRRAFDKVASRAGIAPFISDLDFYIGPPLDFDAKAEPLPMLPCRTSPIEDASVKLGVSLDHPAALYVASVALGSRRSMIESIRKAATMFGCTPSSLRWETLTFAHMTALRGRLAERFAPATGNRILCAVRRVLKFAARLGLCGRDDVARAVDLPPILGQREPAGRCLSRDELQALFATCATSGDAFESRDRCLLALLCGAGLRRAEVAALDVSDVAADVREITVRHGKGNKERVVPLPDSVRKCVEDWLRLRRSLPVARASNALCVPVLYGRHKVSCSGRLSGDAVFLIVRRLAQRAGVSHCSPHDCRRTYITGLLGAGVDLVSVQKLAGHSVPASTVGYDRRPYRTKREAVERLHVGRRPSSERSGAVR